MRDYIILNGQISTEITGLLIQSLPPISKPLLRTEVEEIDGRNGDIVTPLGYSAYDKEITIGLYGNYDIDKVIAYFNTSGTVTFSNEPDKYYNYQIVEQINFDKLIRFRTANVVFHVQPFKFSHAETPRTFEFTAESEAGTKVTLKTTGAALNDIQIYGNSQQSGTPATNNYVPVKVVLGQNNAVFTGGNSSVTYTYNLGSTELAKISFGSELYQDRIYKNGSKWYIRKAVGKYEIDTDDITAISTYTNIAYAVIPKPTDAKNYNTKKSAAVLSTSAVYSSANSNWDNADNKNKIFARADETNYWVGFSVGTTAAQMKTALDGMIIYYPLATATTEQITDEILVTQLDALYGADTFDGTTTIKATQYARAMPVYFASVINRDFIVQNIGNYKAKPILTIYGSGDIVVKLNGVSIFNIALGTENYITIDTEQMEAYKGNVLKNRLVAGSYDNLLLNVGGNEFRFGGSVTKVVIENYSRWL